MSINRVEISGNLTRDPELTVTPGGTQILRVGVAVNDRRHNQQTGQWEDKPNFVDCKLFGNRAESLGKVLYKGMKVAIAGKLDYSQWQDRQTGANRSKLEVIIDEIEFMTPKGQGQGQRQQQSATTYQQQAPAPQPRYQTPPAPVPPAPQPVQAVPLPAWQTPAQRAVAAPAAPQTPSPAYQTPQPQNGPQTPAPAATQASAQPVEVQAQVVEPGSVYDPDIPF